MAQAKAKKIAVVLFNLGGASKKTPLKEFLFNLFYDRAIINLLNPLRWFLAKFIMITRLKNSQKTYNLIGGYSPLIINTLSQAEHLEKKLLEDGENNIKTFISMRYSYPDVYKAIEDIKSFSPSEIILLPLYPQFSSTTTASSLKQFYEVASKKLANIPIKAICCFYTNDTFISSYAALIDKATADLDLTKKHIYIFSAHGLPKKIIVAGDPYQWQVEETVKKILLRVKHKPLEHKVTYQSRVGPIEWLKPYTDDEIIKHAKEGKSIIIIPISFVSEHVETLVELDIEYKTLAYKTGAVGYIRVPTPSCDELFITSLAEIIKSFIKENSARVLACDFSRNCDAKFKNCISEG